MIWFYDQKQENFWVGINKLLSAFTLFVSVWIVVVLCDLTPQYVRLAEFCHIG